MTLSPKKYTSNFTSSTTNRGVEAKEIEIANTRLDATVSASTQSSAEIDIRSQASGDTGSYLQVIVQKHKRDPMATQTSRLPVASSPIKTANGAGDTQLYVLQQPMLLTYSQTEGKSEPKPPPAKRQSLWSKLRGDAAPDRVEVYYFERSDGESLAISDVFTYSEQVALQASTVSNRIMAEVFAVPQIIASVPVSVFLHVERCLLRVFKGFLVGSVQMASDYILKPTLTLTFNAIVQPPLVFLGNVGRAVREAARPIAGLVGDFLEPLVKVLGALRLVNVEKCGGSHAV